MNLARACLTSAALCLSGVGNAFCSLEEDFFLMLPGTTSMETRSMDDQGLLSELPFPQDLDLGNLGTPDTYINILDGCVETFSQTLQEDELGLACLARISYTQAPPGQEELAFMNDLLLERDVLQEKLNAIYHKMVTHVPMICAILPREIQACAAHNDELFFTQMHRFIRLMRLYTTAYSFGQRLLSPLRSAAYFSPSRMPALQAFEYVMTQHAWLQNQIQTSDLKIATTPKKKVPSFSLEKMIHVHKVVSTYEGLMYFYHLFGNPPLYKTFKLIQGKKADDILKNLHESLYDLKVTPYMLDLLWSITPHKNKEHHTAFSDWFVSSDKTTLLHGKILYVGLLKLMEDFGPLTPHDTLHFKLFFRTTIMHLDGEGSLQVVKLPQVENPSPKAKITKKRRGRAKRR